MKNKLSTKQETIQDKNYADIIAAEKEVLAVLEQIEGIYATVEDEAQAKKIIVVRFAHKLHQAIEHSKRTYDIWIHDLKKDEQPW